jgi:hypothetical protein
MVPDDVRHIDEATVADFLDGELADAERERVAAHLEECSECRAELRELNALAESVPSTPVVASRRRPRRTTSRLTLFGGALAASIAAIAVIRQTTSHSLPAIVSRPRAVPEGAGHIEAVAPATGDVPQSDVRFSWHSSNVDAYRFALLDESGQVLFTHITTDTTITWPRSVSQSLGGVYFWRVDGIGDGVNSSTGARRLRIVR